MKQIAIFFPHIGEYGGIERNIIALAENLSAPDLIPVLVCFYDKIDMSKYCPELQIVILKDHWNPVIKAFRLKKWLRENRKDIKGFPLFFGSKSGFYAAIANISSYALHYTDPPSLLTNTDLTRSALSKLLWFPRNWLSNKLIEQGVAKASRWITMTHWNTHELKQLYRKDFHVIHQGGVPPRDSLQNAKKRCNGPELRIFSICRVTSSKNIDWIIETAKYIKTTEPLNQFFSSVKVIIAGKGPEIDNLMLLADKLGMKDNISFPGFLTEQQVECEYRNADLFLVPARQGFGLPVLEALYREVPVVLNIESHVSEILDSNPWAAISSNSCHSFKTTVCQHILAIRNNYPDTEALKQLPTEKLWAKKIADHCHWS